LTEEIPRGRIFRNYVEENYSFGEFALVRVRGDRAEVGFVLAEEDISKWPLLQKQTLDMARYLMQRIKEEGLSKVAVAGVGKDLDFFTVSIVVNLEGMEKEEIFALARKVMSLLQEVNPY